MIRVGNDLIEIDRIRQSLSRPGFLERVYGEEEIRMLRERGDMAPGAAANFAAKEAFAKALGTGVRGFDLREVQTLRDESGAPFLVLCGNAKELAKGWEFSVSLSHTNKYASAVVIAERTGRN